MPVVGGFKHALVSDGTGLNVDNSTPRGCPLWVDTVEKVVSDPPKRNNRIRTARYLNRNCIRGRDFESMLRIQGRKIVFQQYRSKADICAAKSHVRFTPMCGRLRDGKDFLGMR